jgi:hypothetical protein
MLSSTVLALLLEGAAATAARPAPPRPGLSWADADSLAAAFAKVEKVYKASRRAPAGSLVVTESQLNSYLNLTLAPKIPPGVSDVQITLAGDGLAARAKVDLDRVPLKRPTEGAWSLYRLLSGTVPVELAGALQSRDGVGTIELRSVRLGGWAVPSMLVAQLVSSSTRTAESPTGFDINAPFRLPYAMKRVRFEAGRAVVDF